VFAVSTNLSLSGMTLAIMVALFLQPIDAEAKVYLTISGCAFVLFATMSFITIRFPRRWVSIITLLPFWSIFFLVLWSVLTDTAQVSNPADGLAQALVDEAILDCLKVLPFVLLFSLISDAAVVAVIRKLFISISKSLSLWQIIKMNSALVLLFIAILPAPYFLLKLIASHPTMKDMARITDILVLLLNSTTAMYCLIPFLFLAVLFVHKMLWPLLSRLLYPVVSRKVITNRKLLYSIASLSITYAFNLEQVGLKELVKLLPRGGG